MGENHRAMAAMLVTAVCVSQICAGSENTVGLPSAETVVIRMMEMDQSRAAALKKYTSQRRYFAENPRFSQSAEVIVQASYTSPDKREFKTISESGSPTIRHRVIQKLIEAEIEAGRAENRDQGHMTPDNYTFRMIGVEKTDGRSCFVLEVIPKVAKKFLMRGRIYVDDKDFAIVRMEGSPAKNPSIWTRKTSFVRRYEKHGIFWLPASVDSDSDILIAGRSTLRIEYSGYEVQ